MTRALVLVLVLAAVAACTPVRMAGSAVVGAGQIALGAADVVL
jgi:hypothetical protein